MCQPGSALRHPQRPQSLSLTPLLSGPSNGLPHARGHETQPRLSLPGQTEDSSVLRDIPARWIFRGSGLEMQQSSDFFPRTTLSLFFDKKKKNIKIFQIKCFSLSFSSFCCPCFRSPTGGLPWLYPPAHWGSHLCECKGSSVWREGQSPATCETHSCLSHSLPSPSAFFPLWLLWMTEKVFALLLPGQSALTICF